MRSRFSILFALLSLTAISFIFVSACTDQSARAKQKYMIEESSKPGVFAKIGDQELTEEMLIGEDKAEFFELEKRRYEMLVEKLDKMVTDRLLSEKAKKAGKPVDRYVEENILKGKMKVSDADFKKFVKERKIPEDQITPDLKGRIESFLLATKRQELIQADVAPGFKTVKLAKKKPKLRVPVEAGTGPAFGKADAAVTIVEFSDFQCPFCSRAADTVHELKKKYGNKVRLVFRHYPLPMHKDARPASEASMCINDQKADSFWKYHDLLFKNQDKLDAESLAKYAKQVGADEKKFKECVEAKKFAEFVQQDLSYGEKIGVRSTPTFFVNGQLIAGALPMEAFQEVIEEELEEAKKK